MAVPRETMPVPYFFGGFFHLLDRSQSVSRNALGFAHLAAASGLAPRPQKGRQAAVWHVPNAACFRQQFAQGRLGAAARVNTRWRMLAAAPTALGYGLLCDDCQHASPAVGGGPAGGGSQTGRHLPCPGFLKHMNTKASMPKP